MTKLEDAYKQYRALGFVMNKTAHHKKHAFREGAYIDRENEDWDDKATGYVGIVPPSLIIVDNDSYKDGGASFKKLLKDLELDYVPEPFALTPSGGEHYAFKNPYEDLVIGSTEYECLDIYAGYQTVIPIVGTTVKNKQDKLAMYEWASFDDTFVINPFNEKMKELFNMRPRSDKTERQYDEDGTTLGIKEQEMPLEEVMRLIELIPIEDYRYDTGYLKFGMAMYDRFEGSEEGLAIFQEACKRYPDNDEIFNAKKWNRANFKPSSKISYKTLRSLANEGHTKEINLKLEKAKTNKDFLNLVEYIHNIKRINSSSDLDITVRNNLANKINQKMKEAKKSDASVEVIQARTLVKQLLPNADTVTTEGTQLYLCRGSYAVQQGGKLSDSLGTTILTHYLNVLGFKSAEDKASLLNNTVLINDIRRIPNYTIGEESKFSLKENKGIEYPSLIVHTNPLINIKDYEHDDEILQDFLHDIWNGKLEDIVRIIALTIKTKEQKLNRLMLVAPSNSGKTEIATMLKFQKITMARLLNGVRGAKGIGEAVIRGIKNSALLLIDEANTSLSAEIKDMDKELHIDQFGTGGTQVCPLYFTILTSTHKTATRNNSDELYNRFLQVELLPSEMKHTIMQSEVFLKNTTRYLNVTKSYLLYLFKTTMDGDEGAEELLELQNKYRLPINSDLETLLYEIGDSFIQETKRSATEHGEVRVRNGEYFYKRKGDIISFFEDKLKEIQGVDVGKYLEKLCNHFISKNRVSIKSKGEVTNFYKVELIPFTEDEEEIVKSKFDDLDLEDL